MTHFANKRFSVSQSGRSPEDCGHGWIVKGRCWYCGTSEDLIELEAMEWASYALLQRRAEECCTPSPPEPSE